MSTSLGLDTSVPLRCHAVPDRVSDHFTEDAASLASTGINRELNEETFDLPEEILSRSMFEEIDGSSEAICRVTAQVKKVAPSDATHALKVRACNCNGIWDRSGISFLVAQKPYFYETGWFRLVAVIAFVPILTGGYRVRLHQMHVQMHARLDERVTERMRIDRDLHDTLLQSFRGLLPRFQAIQNLLPGRIAEAQQVLEAAIDDAALFKGKAETTS